MNSEALTVPDLIKIATSLLILLLDLILIYIFFNNKKDRKKGLAKFIPIIIAIVITTLYLTFRWLVVDTF